MWDLSVCSCVSTHNIVLAKSTVKMFSGLGSISDLNQQFAQFTSNLTNLDSLQDGSVSGQPNSGGPGQNEQKSDSLHTLKAENTELRVELQTQQSLVEDLKAYLSVKDSELNLKETEADGLRDSIRCVERAEAHSAKELADYKRECERKIQSLTDTVAEYQRREKDLLTAQKLVEIPPGQPHLPKSDDYNLPITATNHEAMLTESQESYKAAQRTIADLTRRLDQVTSDLARAAEVESELRAEAKLVLEQSLSLSSSVEDMRVQLRRADESAVSSTDELRAQLDEKTVVIERLEADMQGYLNNIVELNEEHNATLERCASAESRCVALEERLRTVLDSSELNSASTSDALGELGRARELAEDRARLVQEAENKVTTLTEKLKDMMHRFAELKSKSTSQAQQLQERVTEITKLAQAKVYIVCCCTLPLQLQSLFVSFPSITGLRNPRPSTEDGKLGAVRLGREAESGGAGGAVRRNAARTHAVARRSRGASGGNCRFNGGEGSAPGCAESL